MRAKPMLRQLMKQQGREHQFFAELLGVSKDRFSRIASGTRPIDPIQASVIAGALGVPLLFVFESPSGDEMTPTRDFVEGAA